MKNTNITINAKNRTIELTKTTAKAASKFGTKAYDELQEVRRAYPNYTVITVAKKSAKPKYKGLNCEFMKKYIADHDDENKSIMGKFLDLRGESDVAKINGVKSADFVKIRAWFLNQYPEIEEFGKDREELLINAAKERAARKAA